MCTTNEVGYTPWRPSGTRFLRDRNGMMYVTKGSDLRPGILRLPRFFIYRCGKICIFYSVTFTYSYSLLLTHSLILAHKTAHTHSHSPTHTLTHTHSLILAYTPRHTHSAPCSLRARRGIMSTVIRVGYSPLASRGLRTFCAAGTGKCILPRGQIYARAWLGFGSSIHCSGVGCTLRRPSGSAAFACQPWNNKKRQDSNILPGVPRAPILLRGSRRATHSLADFFRYAHSDLLIYSLTNFT